MDILMREAYLGYYSPDEIRDVTIEWIGQCHELSTTDKASGVTGAYIVRYSFEYCLFSEWRSASGYEATLLEQDGQWIYHAGYRCP